MILLARLNSLDCRYTSTGFRKKIFHLYFQLLPPSDFYNTAVLQNWSIDSAIKEYCMSIAHPESNLNSAYEKYKSCVEKATIREMKDFEFLTRNKSKLGKVGYN